MDERDRAYQQRWDAQEKATDAAFNAQEKAITAAFNAQEKLVTSALRFAEISGKSKGLNEGWVYLLGFASLIGTIGALIAVFHK